MWEIKITNNKLIQEYNKMGFIAPVMVEIIDHLKESTEYKKTLKMHLNGAMAELQKIHKKHFESYDIAIEVPNPGGTTIDSQNIYNNTGKAYDFILQKTPSEVAQIAELVRRFEADGNKLSEIETYYFPVEKSINGGK